MSRIYVDVVCDLFHYGHVRLFERARSLGTELVVGVCGDDLAGSYKRRPVLTLEERAEMVRSCRFVDEVIEDPPCPVTVEFLDEHRIDFVVHGDDFSPDTLDYWYGDAIRADRFRTIPYTEGISTSEIIGRIANRVANNDLSF